MASFLLDTHVFIWIDSEPEQISDSAMDIIQNQSNDIWLSTVSIWEIQIKKQLGKIKLNGSLEKLIETQLQINNFKLLDVKLSHILKLDVLPDIHKDPFDRMLVSQSLIENFPLIKHDAQVHQYSINTIW